MEHNRHAHANASAGAGSSSGSDAAAHLNSTDFFVIDVHGLTQPAGRPKHLAARFGQKIQPAVDVHRSGPGSLAPSPIGNHAARSPVAMSISPTTPQRPQASQSLLTQSLSQHVAGASASAGAGVHASHDHHGHHSEHSHSNGAARHTAFIEARRAKLARRTDHIRQAVAAVNQRMTGDSSIKRSRIQETLELASRNRQSLMNERVQMLAQTVAHAKAVARSQALKAQQEKTALKSAIDARMHTTAKRRQRLLTIPRSRLFDPDSWANQETELVRDEAAEAIQAWWRRCKLAPLVLAFRRTGLSIETASAMPFQRLIRMLQTDRLIKAAGRLLLRAKKLADPPISSSLWKNPARVFLSAYMIIGHPQDTLQTIGPQEQDLKSLAESMLADFDAWTATAAATPADDLHILGRSFLKSYMAYYAAFEAWKSQDMHKLIDDLVSHFLDLERLWLSVKDQEDAETEWAPRIDEQQHQIHDRIEKFGAPAIARLEAARSRLHAELAAQDVEMVPSSPIRIPSAPHETRLSSSPDTRLSTSPESRQTRASFISATSESAHRSTSPQLFQSQLPGRRADSVTQSRRMSSQSSRSGRSGSPTKSPERTGRQQQQQQQPVTNDQRNEPSMPSASHGMAPAIQSVAPEFGQVFSNEQLAHELVMDPDFSLKRPKRSQFEEQVAAVARRAFFDGVRDEIAQSGYGSQVLGILSDIKQGLLSMVSEQGHVAQEIHEALDFDLIKQQMSRFVFDLPRCIAYIASKMLQLCAPMRDASIRALATETDVVSALARTLEIVDEMKLDLANYRLQKLKPHLMRQAVEYERQKFTVALANGQASLARTTEWLETAVHALESVAASRNPENLSHPDLRVRYEDVFHTAILSLVFGTTPIGPDNVPETLSMDAERLFGFQNEAQALTIVSALLMLSKNILPELRSEPLALKELREKLFVLLKDSGTNVESLSLIIISTVNGLFARKAALLESLSQTTSSAHVLQAGGSHTRRVSSEQESLVRNMVDKTLSYRDPVFTLLSRRIQNVVRQHMERGSFRRDSLASHGLDLVGTELEGLSLRVATLARHNKEVFSTIYDDILGTLI